jgi:hypothetical protein
MISRTYDPLAKPSVSLGKRNPFAFAGFSASSRPKTQGSEINSGFGARAADVARACNSEQAPQAVGIESLKMDSENGAAGSSRPLDAPATTATRHFSFEPRS